MQKIKKKYNWKGIGFLISVGIIPLLNFIVFYLYLNFDSFFLAFQVKEGNAIAWGFDNFRNVLKSFSFDGELFVALKNTAIWCAVNIFLYVPQLLSTYFIYKRVRGYKFAAFMTMLPGLLPASAYVGMVKYILAPEGLFGFFYSKANPMLPAPSLLRDSSYANTTMIVYTIWKGLGMQLIWNGAMNNISGDILEAGRIDGTNWFSELTRIIIPLMWPTLSVSVMFTVAGLLGASGPVLVFTNGDYGTTTLSFWIFNQVRSSGQSGSYGMPAALGLLMSCISIPLVLIVRKLSSKVEVY